jgi:hypothetical protein
MNDYEWAVQEMADDMKSSNNSGNKMSPREILEEIVDIYTMRHSLDDVTEITMDIYMLLVDNGYLQDD